MPAYVLLVGDDDVIPFFRKDDPLWPDHTESSHTSTDAVLGPIVNNDFFLTDNPYGDTDGSDWNHGRLEKTVGRLVGDTALDLLTFLGNAMDGPALGSPPRAVMASWDIFDLRLFGFNNDALEYVQDWGFEAGEGMIDDNQWRRSDYISAISSQFTILVNGTHSREKGTTAPPDEGRRHGGGLPRHHHHGHGAPAAVLRPGRVSDRVLAGGEQPHRQAHPGGRLGFRGQRRDQLRLSVRLRAVHREDLQSVLAPCPAGGRWRGEPRPGPAPGQERLLDRLLERVRPQGEHGDHLLRHPVDKDPEDLGREVRGHTGGRTVATLLEPARRGGRELQHQRHRRRLALQPRPHHRARLRPRRRSRASFPPPRPDRCSRPASWSWCCRRAPRSRA